MADMTLHPKNLIGLDLNFTETIYVIAFGLEDEVRMQGKEVVFRELGMTAEEMEESVRYCLSEVMYYNEAYALRRVLGNLDSSENDEKIFGRHASLASVFNTATSKLQLAQYRAALVKPKGIMACTEEPKSERDMELLYTQVQYLMNEVRSCNEKLTAYNERRDRALEDIKTLMNEIKQRRDCPEHFGEKLPELTPVEIKLGESVAQIPWPYRSMVILSKLDLHTVGEVVEYFQDFNHFVESDDITLMEWSVITSILHKNGLSSKESYETVGLQDKINVLELSVRALNCLTRGGIRNFDDLMEKFSCGAKAGWDKIWRIRNLGRVSYEEVIVAMKNIEIILEDSFCFPTVESSVRALDFDCDDKQKLGSLGLVTIGDLLIACRDENRFRGLRYIDNGLYLTALDRLDCYAIGLS